jgi:penicillin-binding protein 1C
MPEDVKIIEVCAASGFPPGPDCETLGLAEAPRNAPAQDPCPYCRTLTLDESGLRQVALREGSGEAVIRKKWFVLPPAEEWYYRRWNLDYRPPPAEGAAPQTLPLALFNPEPGAQVYVPIELDGRPGRIIFSAAHREDRALIHWHLDDAYLGFTTVFHELEARPSPGRHTLTLVDAQGNTLSRSFEVLARID